MSHPTTWAGALAVDGDTDHGADATIAALCRRVDYPDDLACEVARVALGPDVGDRVRRRSVGVRWWTGVWSVALEVAVALSLIGRGVHCWQCIKRDGVNGALAKSNSQFAPGLLPFVSLVLFSTAVIAVLTFSFTWNDPTIPRAMAVLTAGVWATFGTCIMGPSLAAGLGPVFCLRTAIRRRYGIPGSVLADWAAETWHSRAALAQAARTVARAHDGDLYAQLLC